MFQKYLITLSLILSLVCSSFLPIFATKAMAQFAVIDPAHIAVTQAESTRKTILEGLDLAARIATQVIIQKIVASTVAWANSGFEGNPAYAIDPKQYFADIANGIAGEFIAGSDLGFLCSPFQTQIRLALLKSYSGQERQFQCTLTQVVGNIDAFYGDFSQGGWDGWFSMTQNSSNNPYGSYLNAQVELDSRIAKAVGLQEKQLDWNQGLLSWSECLPGGKDPDTGECRPDMRGPVQTPGSVIKANLDKVLPSGLERVINAQHMEQLVEAFASGILTRYVFGSQGLFK